jgi:glycosyltransferase involved in cell wall biosynthesis
MADVPAVSVVIPHYNKGPYIARALNSVLTQTFPDFEVIVVDDGSTDDGAEIIRGFDDPRIRLIQQENRGVSAARNRGIEAARAELVAFLDADDEWLPKFLETILRLRRKFPEAGAYATAFIEKFSNGTCQKLTFSEIPQGNWEGLIPSYFRSCASGRLPVRSSNVAIPKKVFFSVGMFPVGEWWGEDTDMWGRVALRYPIGFSSGYYAIYNVGATNRTCDMRKIVKIHPFVRTACQAIDGGSVPESILPDLERYITKEILQTAQMNLKAGRPDLAREDLSQCPKKFISLKQVTLLIWTYMPTSLFHFYRWILRQGLDSTLIIKLRLHSKMNNSLNRGH